MSAVMEERAVVDDDFDPFAGSAVERVVATTEAQRELWLGDQLAAEASLAFNESTVLRMRGPLDTEALAAAMAAVVARHESLRATISPDGMQLLVAAPGAFPLATVDLRALTPDAQAQALARAGEAAVLERFSLSDGPLFRARLFALSPTEHVLMMTAHHAVCDGWSWGVIVQDLGELYAEQLGLGPSLPPPQAQYSDFSRWEAEEAEGSDMRAHEAYWQSRFSGSLPVLDLPVDRPRAPVRTFTARRIDHTIGSELAAAVRKLGSSLGQSLFSTLLGAFAATVHRVTEQEDLVVGIASAGQLASGMPGLVGHCVNVLPLRFAVEGKMPFDQLARQAAGTLLDATEHQMAYGALLKKLSVPRDPSRLPLVNILFNLDRDAPPPDCFPDLSIEQSSLPRLYENFELFLNVVASPDGLRVETQYNADLFDDATVRRWLGLYEALLRAAVAAPAQAVGQLDFLPPAELARLQALQPAATAPSQPALMHAAFVRQAALHADRVALSDGDERLSYRQLDEASNRLAHELRARGIGRGQRVGICIPRGTDMIVAVFATLKSGAAYVPLDPDFPQSRLDYYAEDARLALLLTSARVPNAPAAGAGARFDAIRVDADTAWRERPAAALAADEARDPRPDDAAYVIYTSGSTGKPKGVCVPHRAAANLLDSMRAQPGIVATDRWAAVTTLSFDMAVPELMLPLAAGAEVQIVQREVATDGNALAEHMQRTGTTILQATPGMWRILFDSQWTPPAGFKALVGAEPLPADLARELLARCPETWNMYGPTETTVWSTCWRLDPAVVAQGRVSIGTPMANTTVWIVSADGQPCPVGVPGEIWIGGTGVTLGYLDRPELTAERFVQAEFPAARGQLLYRTGDRGRWRNDGLLEHLGRFDFQVKVRGYRIELGEIEARCNEVDGVARSVLLAREDRPGDVRLVAYLARTPGQTIDLARLDAHLKAALPKYMIPQHVVVLDALPQLPNGKIDRRALPAPQGAGAAPERGEAVAPRNDLEREVVGVMEKVLSLPGIGIHDDFFALGGHSLLAARLTTTLGRHFGIKLPMATLFEAPTAAKLSEVVARLKSEAAPAAADDAIRVLPGRRSAPLTVAQDRIRFMEELYPGRSVYNAPSGHRFRGPLDIGRFHAALKEIVRRQPSLRTCVGRDAETGEPVQSILPEVPVALEVVDLRDLPVAEREARLMLLLQAAADAPFDIARAPLFRFALYQMGVDDHAFIFVPHHLVWDGWSFDVFQSELSTIYRALVEGRPHGLPELAVTHGDYAQWFQDWQATPDFQRQLDHWKSRFAKAAAPTPLPSDRPRRAAMSGEGGTVWVQIERARADELREAAQRQDLTLSMFAFAAYVLTMADINPNRSIVVAMPVRAREQPELEVVMGFFNNVLPLSFSFDPAATGQQFLRYVKSELLSVMNYQLVPFERLVMEPEFAERTQGMALYQTLFSFQDARERPVDIGGLGHQQVHLRQKGVTDDLALWLLDKAKGIEGPLGYNADLYTHETATAFRDRFVEVLDQLAARPQARLEEILAGEGSASAAHLRALASRTQAQEQEARQQPAAALRDAAPARLLLPEQAKLAQIWSSALGIDVNDIRADDHFFDLGGDSLMAMRVMQQAEPVMGFRIEASRYVFESLAQLASAEFALPAAPAAAPAAERPAPERKGLLGRMFGLGRR
ncbi:non-ribosomal peptide synthetase [Xenophilus aerolatus]